MYSDKVKIRVQEDWPQEWKNSPNFEEGKKVPAPPIHFFNKVAKLMFEDEPLEVQNEVEAFRKEVLPDDNDLEGEGEDDDVGEKRRVAIAKSFQG
jgi:hypothetical protein